MSTSQLRWSRGFSRTSRVGRTHPELSHGVDVHRSANLVVGQLENALDDQDAGVVDQYVDVAELAANLRRHGGNVVDVGDVTAVGLGRATRLGDDASRFGNCSLERGRACKSSAYRNWQIYRKIAPSVFDMT